MEKTKMEV